MRIRKLAQIASAAAVLSLIVTTPGRAASMVPSHTTHLTFSGPVGLPGVILPGGTYTFEVIALHPNIVRVLSRDGSQIYFTGFTWQVTRPAMLRADRLVTFGETPRGVAPRVNAWYPMGKSTGHQFIYSETAR